MSFGIPVRNGLGLGLLASTSLATGNVGGSAPFTPASLFASGAPGFLLDATLADLSSLYQDSAGTTPVTAVEQPVGLALDTSRGLALGPELVTNGTFDANINGWAAGTTSGGTIAWQSPGSMRITRTSATTTGQRTISVLAGVTYIITAQSTFVSGTGNPFLVIKDTDAAATGTILTNSSGPVAQSFSHVAYFTAPSTGTLYIHAGIGTANSVYDFDNITTKSIAGNHFVQSTSAARPVLSARVNLLTKTEQFNDAVWTKSVSSTITANSTTAPDGTTTADTYTSTGTAAFGREVIQSFAYVAGNYTFSCYAKAGTAGWAYLQMGVGANVVRKSFNLNTGASGSTQTFGTGYVFVSSSITDAGSGWYRLVLTATTPTATANATVGLANSDNGASISTGEFNYLWGADLRVANDTASPVYQRVNTATDYATTGFPIYLRYDGVDDFLVSAATVNFSTTAQMSVFAGVRKIVDPAGLVSIIVELSDATTNNRYTLGGFLTPSTRYFTTSGGTLISGNEVTSAAFSAPISNVLTGLADIISDINQLRINGGLQSSSTADQGTGNYPNALTWIGQRGAGLPYRFNGRIYFPMVVLGRTATATEIANMESFLNTRNGIY
jgi:hypothetical protein